MGSRRVFDMGGQGRVYDGLYFFGGDFVHWLVKNKGLGRLWRCRPHASRRFRRRSQPDRPDADRQSARRRAGLDFYGGARRRTSKQSTTPAGETLRDRYLVPGIEHGSPTICDFIAEAGFSN